MAGGPSVATLGPTRVGLLYLGLAAFLAYMTDAAGTLLSGGS